MWSFILWCVSVLLFCSVTATEEVFDVVLSKKPIDEEDGVEVTCLAEGLYPQPTLEMLIE